jgi:murein L,D-transpeptidase YcbB/YkuD
MELFRCAVCGKVWIWVAILVFMASSVQAARDREVEAKLPYAELMAQEIEARIVALQLAYEGSDPKSIHFLNQAVGSFYQQRQYRPAWNNQTRLSELIYELESLTDDGLNPDDYQVAQLRNALPWVEEESIELLGTRVDDELRATTAYLRAIYHLFNGKVDPAGLDPQWNFELEDLALTSIGVEMIDIMDSGSIHDLFAKTRPQHPIYRSLVAGLAHYRQLEAAGGWPSLPAGPALKPCMVDPQIAILRERLRVTGEYTDPQLTPDETRALIEKCQAGKKNSSATTSSVAVNLAQAASEGASSSVAQSSSAAEVIAAASSSAVPVNPAEVFDEYLVEAVKQFQRDQYLEVDGAIGPATRATLNISARARVDQIRVNLDRARWLLHNIPPEMVLVDVAGFKVTYFKANQPIWRSRVQVGMSYRTSPIFKSEVNYITLNPTWTIPPTILRKDVLPKVRKDLNYLRENKIRVLDSNGKVLDPATIDWYRPGNVTLRQDAGPHSALGKAVIRFPNTHAVYLHDTPHQKLFNKSQRAFSSGCIRVERALELVELLLAETPGWDKAAINQALDAGKTRNVTLAKRVPILLAYWTVDAINENKIAFKPDIYARDAAVLAALNERK